MKNNEAPRPTLCGLVSSPPSWSGILPKSANWRTKEDKKKKLAMVSSILPATNYTAYLIEALQKRFSQKIETFVYTGLEKENKKTNLKNIKLVWSKNLAYPFQVLNQVLKDKPQIVHIQHEINMFGDWPTALIFPLLPFLLKMARVKVVITIHAVVSQKQIDIKFLETFWRSEKKFFVPLVRIFFNLLFKSLGWFSDKIIVHSQGLKNILVKNYGLNDKKIIVILEGIPDEIRLIKKEKVTKQILEQIQDRQFMLYYGYLHKRKKVELLFKVLQLINKKHPQILLVIAGGTLQKDYEEELKKMVLRLNLVKKVIFLGFVKEDDLNWLINQSIFVLLPASYSIAASGPLAQIVAQHKPLIASRMGVFKEEIKDGIEGLLADNSAAEWALKAEQLIENRQLVKKIVGNLKNKHQQRTWSIIAKQTYNLYKTL